MPSSATTRNRLEKQAAGENLNTWGAPKLNTLIDLVDQAMDGWTTKALTADYSLTSTNYAADESRQRTLKFTGTGSYTVTLPSVEKNYIVWNALTGTLTLTTGAGTTATLATGEKCIVTCDATNVYRVQPTDFQSARITSVGTPTASSDAATKAYVDGVAFTANAGILPGQSGNSGKYLTTNGTTASWAAPLTSQIVDYASDQAIKTNTATLLAISYACSLP